MTSADPLAHERFRTIVSDVMLDARSYYGERAADHTVLTEAVASEFPEAHFEYRTNEQGVRVRKVVVEGREEVYAGDAPDS